MGRRPRASAFLVTKRVCGIGPSCASISSTTPSTIDSARSTSPPKSAWPGVSTMLMCVPFQLTAQFLARMVMPRSRSMALLSITVSTTFSCSAKVPDWRSSWSTMVVLPWSTWAMMAMFRICLSYVLWLGYAEDLLDFDRAQQARRDQFAGLDVGGAEQRARLRRRTRRPGRRIGPVAAPAQAAEEAPCIFRAQRDAACGRAAATPPAAAGPGARPRSGLQFAPA